LSGLTGSRPVRRNRITGPADA